MTDMNKQKVFVVRAGLTAPEKKGAQQDELNALLDDGWHVKDVHITESDWLVVVEMNSVSENPT